MKIRRAVRAFAGARIAARTFAIGYFLYLLFVRADWPYPSGPLSELVSFAFVPLALLCGACVVLQRAMRVEARWNPGHGALAWMLVAVLGIAAAIVSATRDRPSEEPTPTFEALTSARQRWVGHSLPVAMINDGQCYLGSTEGSRIAPIKICEQMFVKHYRFLDGLSAVLGAICFVWVEWLLGAFIARFRSIRP